MNYFAPWLVAGAVLNFSFQASASDWSPREHKVRKISFWKGFQQKSLESKVFKAPTEIIDYITQDNIAHGWPNRPLAVELSPEYQRDFIDAIKEMPDFIKTMINAKTVGVFVVSDLGGTGYTESVYDEETGKPVAAFVVLDAGVLNRSANEWGTWKESSPFQTNNQTRLTMLIEDAANDTRKNAIQYILLHEFGHVVSVGRPEVPLFGLLISEMGPIEKYKFTKASWKIQDDSFASLFDDRFPERTQIRYYGHGESLGVEKAWHVYEELEQTNFSTLYGATNPFDDFAESFVSYVHAVVLKKPWQIQIRRSTGETLYFRSCWNTFRCHDKQKTLETILGL